MRKYTPKRQSEERRQKKWRDKRLAKHPACWVGWEDCTGDGTTLHHRLKRSAMPSAIHYIGDIDWDFWQFIPVCSTCNAQIEDEPARAKEEMWTVTAHQARDLFPHLFTTGEGEPLFMGRANR